MKRSTHAILTTHTGSLPRPDDLVDVLYAAEIGEAGDKPALQERVRSAVADSVREQIEAGIDIEILVHALEQALAIGRDCPYGNGASIFTRSGWAAREFKHRINCGMVGINIGVPASMAWFPFNGWNDSFFGDLHMQGKEGVQFFTQQKVTTSRWFSYGEGDIWHTEKK